jgi:hypothetical protein
VGERGAAPEPAGGRAEGGNIEFFKADSVKNGINNMMSNSDSFQQRYSFEERQLKAREYLSKFSDSVPVILQRTKNTQNLPSIAEEKYVVKRDSNLVTFNRIVIKKLKEEALIDEVKSLFLIL